MTFNSLNATAQQAYSQIQNRPKLDIQPQENVQKIGEFQEVFKQQFNSFAKMSPQEILAHIKTSNNRPASTQNFITSTLKNVKTSFNNHEQTVRKSLIGEASAIDLLTVTTEAKNTVEVLTKTRDKFVEGFNQIMNMSI